MRIIKYYLIKLKRLNHPTTTKHSYRLKDVIKMSSCTYYEYQCTKCGTHNFQWTYLNSLA